MRRRALHVTVVFALLTGLFAMLGGAASAAPASTQTATPLTYCGINLVYVQGAYVVARNATPAGTQVGSNATIAVDLYSMFGRFFNMGGAPWGPLPYVGFQVTGPNASGATPPSGTVKADSNGRATITYTNSLAGTDKVLVYWDMNNNGVWDCAEPATFVKVTFEAGLSLSPATQVNLADGTDTGTLTATLLGYTSANLPPATAQVLASSTGVLNFTNQSMGAITCDPSGCTATMTLGPTTTTGMDTYTAFLDLNGNGTQDANEASADPVTGTWITLDLAPATQDVPANGVSKATLTATVTGFDTATNPIPATAKVVGTVSGGPSATITFGALSCSGTTCTATATLGPTTTTGTDTVNAFLDLNGNGTQDTDEPSFNSAVVNWTAVTIALAPATQDVVADGTATATVTATITGFNSSALPPAGAVVRGTVAAGGPHAGALSFGAISCTATNCTATATLAGTTTVGTDSITAYLDLNNNNVQDPNEPVAAAVVVNWTIG